jgi:hypothetical protein
MSKVEMSLQEYEDLVLGTADALNGKMLLKKQLIELNDKYINLISKYLMSSGKIWTHAFKEDSEITKDNFKNYVSSLVFDYEQFTEEELYQAVKVAYNGKFNKR